MASAEEKTGTVFIFLDENMPSVQDKTFSGLMSSQQSKISIIPLPARFKGKKYPDYKVVIWMKRAILSGWYQIKDAFSDIQKPVFLFFTTDLDFIEDAKAQVGLTAEQLIEDKECPTLFFKADRICFQRENQEICIHVCRIRQKNRLFPCHS